MSGLDDLPPHTRKCLVAKLVLHDVLRREVSRAAAEGYGDLLARARQDLEAAANDVLGDPFDPEPLEDFLRRLGTHGTPTTSPKRQALAERIGGLVEEAVGAHLDADEHDPVSRVFDAVLSAARALYAHAGVPYEGDVRVRLEAVISKRPHDLPIVDHLVGGRVMQRPGRREVRVVMSTSNFSPGAMHGMPGVLFHELVVHAMSSRPLEGAGSSSQMFGEGWMDVVAREAHDAAVRGEAPLDGFTEAFEYAEETLAAAAVMHEGRYAPTDADPFGYAQRQVGRDAARWIRSALCGRVSAPCPKAWELGLALNRSGLDGRAADHVAIAVERARFDEPLAEAVEAALYGWLEAVGEDATAEDRIGAAEAFVAAIPSTALR